jgi:hypothetical protein
MTRPGYATILEKDSPPMMFNAGDGFHYEKLPEGTRVIYPPGPVDPLPTRTSPSSGRCWSRWGWSPCTSSCTPA